MRPWYPLRFFGDRKIGDISKGDFVEYWMWQNENLARPQPMTGETTPYIPSPNTLRREAGGIMFKYAVDKGWLTGIHVSFPPKTGPLFWHGKGICDGSETAFGRGHTEASAGD